jgi:hypothetical protein
MRNAGIEKISFWISEDEQNTFLQLPVFQDGNLVLSIAFYKSEIDYRAKKARTEKLLTAMDKEDLADAITLHRTEIVYPLAHK